MSPQCVLLENNPDLLAGVCLRRPLGPLKNLWMFQTTNARCQHIRSSCYPGSFGDCILAYSQCILTFMPHNIVNATFKVAENFGTRFYVYRLRNNTWDIGVKGIEKVAESTGIPFWSTYMLTRGQSDFSNILLWTFLNSLIHSVADNALFRTHSLFSALMNEPIRVAKLICRHYMLRRYPESITSMHSKQATKWLQYRTVWWRVVTCLTLHPNNLFLNVVCLDKLKCTRLDARSHFVILL